MTELEFYNTTYKDLIKLNKRFYFEVPQNYFNKSNVFKFLSKIYKYVYNCDGYHEGVNLKLNSATTETLSITKTLNSIKEPSCCNSDKAIADFLIDYNKLNHIKFPHYWWSVIYDIAEIKEGEFVNEVVCR